MIFTEEFKKTQLFLCIRLKILAFSEHEVARQAFENIDNLVCRQVLSTLYLLLLCLRNCHYTYLLAHPIPTQLLQ